MGLQDLFPEVITIIFQHHPDFEGDLNMFVVRQRRPYLGSIVMEFESLPFTSQSRV